MIHIDQAWAENEKTVDGMLMHARAHDEDLFESRGDTIIGRGLRIHSNKYSLTGQCDVVEFHRNENGIQLPHHRGRWIPYPIEYKHGKSKAIDADRLQLCLQAMCLEEMLCCNIEKGALYYGETRRREEVLIDEQLRTKAVADIADMREMMKKGYIPKANYTKQCRQCSLIDICVPQESRNRSVKNYIDSALEDI